MPTVVAYKRHAYNKREIDNYTSLNSLHIDNVSLCFLYILVIPQD